MLKNGLTCATNVAVGFVALYVMKVLLTMLAFSGFMAAAALMSQLILLAADLLMLWVVGKLFIKLGMLAYNKVK